MDRDELRRLWREAGVVRAAAPAPAASSALTFMAAPAASATDVVTAVARQRT